MNLPELKRLAEAATQKVVDHHSNVYTPLDGSAVFAFKLAVSPQTVLELISRIEKLEKVVEVAMTSLKLSADFVPDRGRMEQYALQEEACDAMRIIRELEGEG